MCVSWLSVFAYVFNVWAETRRHRKRAKNSVKRACNAFSYFVKDRARRLSVFSPVRPTPLTARFEEGKYGPVAPVPCSTVCFSFCLSVCLSLSLSLSLSLCSVLFFTFFCCCFTLRRAAIYFRSFHLQTSSHLAELFFKPVAAIIDTIML